MGFTKEMFSPPRPSRKVLDENSEIIGSSTVGGNMKSSSRDIASPSRDAAVAPSDGRFEFPSKIRRLPTVWKELELTAAAYQHLKGEYHVLGLCVSATEMLVRFWSSLVLFIAFSPPLSAATGRVLDKFRIVDEFSCHQLDFLEEQMTKNEYGSIYKTGGLAERLERLVRLFFRIVLICPRLGVRMFYACVNCVGDEVAENVELLSDVVDPPSKVRVSARQSKTRKSKSQEKSKVGEKSPGKKRKIAEVTVEETEEECGELPYYFEERVDYVEEEDTDFNPNLEEDSEDDIDTQEEDTQEDTQEEEEDEEDDEEDDEQVVESCHDEVDENENIAEAGLVYKKIAMLRDDAVLSSAIACPLPDTPTML